MTAKYAEWLDQTYVHFCHLAWQDQERGALRDSMRNLLFLASVNPRGCLTRQYFQLFRNAVLASLRKRLPGMRL